MDKDPFKDYIKQSEPNKRDKGYAWHTAIGLQAVDGLKPSKYLIDTAIKNIEGDISIDEAQELLNSYYEENPKSETIILRKRSGCLMVPLCFMEVPQNLEQLWSMIFQKKRSLVTKICLWMKLFITLQYLYQGYGKFIYFVKAIQEQRQYFLLSICVL